MSPDMERETLVACKILADAIEREGEIAHEASLHSPPLPTVYTQEDLDAASRFLKRSIEDTRPKVCQSSRLNEQGAVILIHGKGKNAAPLLFLTPVKAMDHIWRHFAASECGLDFAEVDCFRAWADDLWISPIGTFDGGYGAWINWIAPDLANYELDVEDEDHFKRCVRRGLARGVLTEEQLKIARIHLGTNGLDALRPASTEDKGEA